VGGTCSMHGGGDKCLQDFGWEARGKRPLGRPRRRWEDNTKMDLRETGIDGANWIRLSQDWVRWRAFVNTAFSSSLTKYHTIMPIPVLN
jgi:hypothetical protein